MGFEGPRCGSIGRPTLFDSATDGNATYDEEGSRIARFVDTNFNGLLDTGDTSVTEYTWDHRNRLTSMTSFATAGGDVASSAEYVVSVHHNHS